MLWNCQILIDYIAMVDKYILRKSFLKIEVYYYLKCGNDYAKYDNFPKIWLCYNIKAERFPFWEEMKNARLDNIYST